MRIGPILSISKTPKYNLPQDNYGCIHPFLRNHTDTFCQVKLLTRQQGNLKENWKKFVKLWGEYNKPFSLSCFTNWHWLMPFRNPGMVVSFLGVWTFSFLSDEVLLIRYSKFLDLLHLFSFIWIFKESLIN